MTDTSEYAATDLLEQVRQRYAAAAVGVRDSAAAASCCPTAAEADARFGSTLYAQPDRDDLPVAAVAASLGCGNPTAVADLRPGERVLDLGSGGGIDVLLSAKRVGPTGFVYGVDMTEEMLDLARSNAAQAGARNVEFVKGTIEDVPLSAGSVDVVISNCVINRQRRQAQGAGRDVPGAGAGRTDRDLRCGRRGPPQSRRAPRAGLLRGLHRRRTLAA